MHHDSCGSIYAGLGFSFAGRAENQTTLVMSSRQRFREFWRVLPNCFTIRRVTDSGRPLFQETQCLWGGVTTWPRMETDKTRKGAQAQLGRRGTPVLRRSIFGGASPTSPHSYPSVFNPCFIRGSIFNSFGWISLRRIPRLLRFNFRIRVHSEMIASLGDTGRTGSALDTPASRNILIQFTGPTTIVAYPIRQQKTQS